MRRLLLAALAATALAVPAAHADPQCFPPPAMVVRDGTLYVTVRDGDCHWTTYAVPLPTHS
jgi:hypothetical protein